VTVGWTSIFLHKEAVTIVDKTAMVQGIINARDAGVIPGGMYKEIMTEIAYISHPGQVKRAVCEYEELLMSHYFKEGLATLFHGDVIESLAVIPDESVDLVFADPPYNLSNGGFTCHAGKQVSVNKGAWDKSKGTDNDFDFHYAWLEACRRVLKPTGSLWVSGTYHSIYACGYALQTQGWQFINDICWFKPNASPNLSCRMFTASHETLLWVRKDKKSKHTFNYDAMKNGIFQKDILKKAGKQMRSVWAVGTPRKDEKIHGKHPTQKPLLLLNRIISASSNPGDIILDPFCGSATTGVSAIVQGRSFIGVDSNKTFLDTLAIPRLKDVLRIDLANM